MIEINIGTAKKILSRMVKNHMTKLDKGEAVQHTPVMLHSSPGIGKSSIVRQLVQDLNENAPDGEKYGFVDLRLATMEASDLNGIPYVSHAGKDTEEMKMSIPDWFPRDPKSRGILFLDELTNAPLPNQHAGYRIVLDREVQTGVHLPDGWVIVAAGNLRTDRTGARDVAPALANRFASHFAIKVDHTAWINYAVGKKLNTQIIGYIGQRPEQLWTFDPGSNDMAFASPRSWESVSRLLDIGFSDDDELAATIGGCVGDAVAVDFLGYREYYAKLPNWEDVMDGKTKYKVPDNDVSLQYAVTSSIMMLMLENYSNTARLKNLEKVLAGVPDEHLTFLYRTIRESGADHKVVSSIVVNTKETFMRVQKHLGPMA